jgi:integrase
MEPITIEEGLAKVKIYEVKNNKDWISYTLVWYIGKKRMRRSISDKKEAIKEAHRIAAELAHGEGLLTEVSRRDLQYYRQCEIALQGVPLHIAVQSYLKATNRSMHKPRPFPEIAEEFVEALASNGKSKRHVQTMKQHMSEASKTFSLPIDAITAEDWDQYLRRKGWSNRTRHNHLISLKAVSNYAKRRGYLPREIATEADKVEQISFVQPNPEIFTPKEMELILKHVEPDGIPFIAIGGFAGIRANEIERLEWKDVDLESNVIKLDRSKTKTKRRRVVPILPNLREWLLPFKNGDNGPVVPVAQPQKKYVKQTTDRINAANPEAKFRWKPNGLRHSFVSYHLALENNPAKTAMICGHSPRQAEENYLELVTKREAEKWFAIMPEAAVA